MKFSGNERRLLKSWDVESNDLEKLIIGKKAYEQGQLSVKCSKHCKTEDCECYQKGKAEGHSFGHEHGKLNKVLCGICFDLGREKERARIKAEIEKILK